MSEGEVIHYLPVHIRQQVRHIQSQCVVLLDLRFHPLVALFFGSKPE